MSTDTTLNLSLQDPLISLEGQLRYSADTGVLIVQSLGSSIINDQPSPVLTLPADNLLIISVNLDSNGDLAGSQTASLQIYSSNVAGNPAGDLLLQADATRFASLPGGGTGGFGSFEFQFHVTGGTWTTTSGTWVPANGEFGAIFDADGVLFGQSEFEDYENSFGLIAKGDLGTIPGVGNPPPRIDIEKYVKTAPTTSGGGEGLTPGFWKQSQHFYAWTNYSPTDNYNTVFGLSAAQEDPSLTLLGALQRGGGGSHALGRHAVAAILNASNPNIDYAFTLPQIIGMVQNAYATNNFEPTKNTLATENEKEADLSTPAPVITPTPGFGDDADTAPGITVPAGTPLIFTYVVTNPGTTPLHDVIVIDDNETPGDTSDDFSPTPTLEGGFNIGDDNADGILDPGEVWIYTSTRNAGSPGTHTNIGTVNGTSPTGVNVTDDDAANYTVPGNAQITITKYVNPNPSTPTTGGGEGLTPGFWKQSQHFYAWTGYNPSDNYDAVFGLTSSQESSSLTLLGALQRGGGGAAALGRHAVAALLNASNPNISYAYTSAQIKAMVQNAYATGNFETAKNALASENEKGADLSTPASSTPPASGYGYDANTAATGPTVAPGTVLTFTLVVTNPGDFSLSNIVVTDDNETPANTGDDFHPAPVLDADGIHNVGDDNLNGTLDSGEVWIYTFTKVASGTGVHTNVADVVGKPPSGPNVTDSNPANYTVLGPITGSIAGTKFLDASGNGFSSDDTALGGVTIKLYADLNHDGVLTSADGGPIATKITASNGTYSFTNLAAGTYFVQEVVPTGYIRTGPSLTGTYTVNLASGQNVTGKDFDNFKLDDCVLKCVYYVINGCKTVTDLSGKLHQGDTVKVYFTIDGPETVSFVSYTAPDPYFVAEHASQQQIFDVATGVYTKAGTYCLTIDVPNCYYQVDLVCGLPIDRLGPAGSNIFYTPQQRLHDSDNGGTTACASCGIAPVDQGQFATIGFWQNKNGQAVINSFNGGSSHTELGNWLASNFPRLFGAHNPYGVNSLAGLTNSQVATVYKSLFNPNGVTKNTYVQAFAVALGLYADTSSLGGASLVSNGLAAKYGFKVTTAGAGLYNVGKNGAAFGVSNNTSLSVFSILQKVDAAFTPATGLFFGGDQTKTSMANNVLNGINTGGDISLVVSDAVSTGAAAPLVDDLHPLASGTLTLSIDGLTGDAAQIGQQVARIADAIASLNASLAQFGVNIVAVNGDYAVPADIRLHFSSTSSIGGVESGVLGVTEAGGNITIITGWNYFLGSDQSLMGADQYDFQTVITHEVGHALGLGHSNGTDSVMFPYLGTDSAHRSLSAADLLIIEAHSGEPEALRAMPSAARSARPVSAPLGLARTFDLDIVRPAANAISATGTNGSLYPVVLLVCGNQDSFDNGFTSDSTIGTSHAMLSADSSTVLPTIEPSSSEDRAIDDYIVTSLGLSLPDEASADTTENQVTSDAGTTDAVRKLLDEEAAEETVIGPQSN